MYGDTEKEIDHIRPMSDYFLLYVEIIVGFHFEYKNFKTRVSFDS
jgi:hypothetical protein